MREEKKRDGMRGKNWRTITIRRISSRRGGGQKGGGQGKEEEGDGKMRNRITRNSKEKGRIIFLFTELICYNE
jgi:hypothetical protein